MALVGNLLNVNRDIKTPSAKVKATAARTIPNNAELQLNFGTATWDNDNIWDPASPTIITIKTSGIYIVQAGIAGWSNANITGTRLFSYLCSWIFSRRFSACS